MHTPDLTRTLVRFSLLFIGFGLSPFALSPFGLSPTPAAAQYQSVEGYYAGTIAAEGSTTEAQLRIYRASGSLRFDLHLPDLGADVRDSEVTSTSTGLRFPVGPFVLDAAVDSAAGVLRGMWGRAGASASGRAPQLPDSRVYLTRKPAPRQNYSMEEVRFSSTGAELSGTLMIPSLNEPVRAAVFVTGRSNGPRNQHRRMAETLAEYGTAALIFDSRGTGQSTGDSASLTERQRKDDVLAAVEYLAGRPEVDAARIGLFTHSAGGWVGPEVVSESDAVSWMIMNQGPVMSLAEQQGLAMNAYMRMQGAELAEDAARRSFEYHAELTRLGQADAEWERIARHTESISDAPWAEYASRPEDYTNEDLDYYRRRPDFDPTDAWREMDIPVLLLFGEDDWIVPWEENVARLEEIIDPSHRDLVSWLVFPNAGHGLMRVGGGMQGAGDWPDAWYRWPSTAPGYEAAIVEWLRSR